MGRRAAIVKAVVLARGKGTRMQRTDPSAPVDPSQDRVASLGLKAMIPFRRPFLDYTLSELADEGFEDVCLVIGPEHDLVRDYYTTTSPPRRVRLRFAVQPEPRGTADAVLAAEAFAGSADAFIVLNGDNYYPAEAFRGLARLPGPGLPVFRRSALLRDGNIGPDRIGKYALLRVAADGQLLDIIEKPDARTLDESEDDFFVSMNCWRFSPHIFEACRAIDPSPRGELELPDAVRYAVRVMNERFQTFPVEASVLDLSTRRDIAAVEERLAALSPDP